MARIPAPESSGWLPEDYDSEVVARVNRLSVVEGVSGRQVRMTTRTRSIPRQAGAGVNFIAIGAAYTEDGSTLDELTLRAEKLGRAFRLAEEDIADQGASALDALAMDWTTAYARMIDCACIGVTAAVGAGVPFQSIRNLTGVTVTSITGVAVTYDDLNNTLAAIETGDFFDPDAIVVMAHPGFRAKLRNLKDSTGNPIYSDPVAGNPPTLFGHPLYWTLGAREHATATDAPTGNQLLVFANRNYMCLGVRSGPERQVIPASVSLTDEDVMKMRARRAFVPAIAGAFAVLQDVA